MTGIFPGGAVPQANAYASITTGVDVTLFTAGAFGAWLCFHRVGPGNPASSIKIGAVFIATTNLEGEVQDSSERFFVPPATAVVGNAGTGGFVFVAYRQV